MNFAWLQTKQSYSFIIEIPNMQSKNMYVYSISRTIETRSLGNAIFFARLDNS